MSKYFYNGTDINVILPNSTPSEDNSAKVTDNIDNYYSGMKRSNWKPTKSYYDSAISDENGATHLQLGFQINGKDLLAYAPPNSSYYTATATITAPTWANHFSCYTVGGGGGGGGGGGRIGNGNGTDGAGGGGAAWNFYRLYPLNGQRSMNVVVGGGGAGGNRYGGVGTGGSPSYVNIDNVNIAYAYGGGGGAGGNAQAADSDAGGGGGQSIDFPLTIQYKSENSTRNNSAGNGNAGANGGGRNRQFTAAGNSNHQGAFGQGGWGGQGGPGVNTNNQFLYSGGADQGYGGLPGAQGSVKIWWFAGTRP